MTHATPFKTTGTLLVTLFALAAGAAGCVADVGSYDESPANDDYSDDGDSPKSPDNDNVDLELATGDEIGASDDTTTIAATASWMDSSELAFVARINEYRKTLNRDPLRVSISLTKAATAQVAWNVSHDAVFLATSTFVQSYYPYSFGQNIIKFSPGTTGQYSPFEQWLAQGGTVKANLGDDRYKVMGIARQYYSPTAYHWVVFFGTYRDAILSAGTTSIGSNGSFEGDPKFDPITGASTWGVSYSNVRNVNRWYVASQFDNSDVARSFGDGLIGNYSLYASAYRTSFNVTQMVTAGPEVKYKVTGKTWDSNSGQSQKLFMQFLGSDYLSISTHSVAAPVGATGWTTISTPEIVAPPGTKYVRYFIYGGTWDVSARYWDDIRVTAL